MSTPLEERLEAELAAALGTAVTRTQPLAQGHVGPLLDVQLADGRRLAVKQDLGAKPQLDLEARMLEALRATHTVPVPAIHHAAPHLLCMDHVTADGSGRAQVEEHAADLLVQLHGIGAPTYGFDYDTIIAGLPQPNGRMPSWQVFFRDRRLLHMATLAFEARQLPARLYARLQLFSEKIHRWLPKPQKPGLIHGDLWGGNVLVHQGRIAALVDPAVYYADPEIELAFVTLFGTFGERFFRRYAEQRPLSPDFFEVRKDVYNLYPLLVHVRLYGGSYVGQVQAILDKLGA